MAAGVVSVTGAVAVAVWPEIVDPVGGVPVGETLAGVGVRGLPVVDDVVAAFVNVNCKPIFSFAESKVNWYRNNDQPVGELNTSNTVDFKSTSLVEK